ncbi:uroporphyrinogen decarboxylase family protein [Oscillatoria laete-virens NRMC-F 0139]|nr:uroporphyrinogen decarboxylase family protein [Oscillatoria laete-virens]MDL5053149.1 uroporphyrinogen decarboxylase family protein [Oscillatoria laete-virens NRMC-F 0139]
MTSKERIQAVIGKRKPDRLPNMAITMMFACDQIGARYRDYATNHRVIVEAQLKTAEKFQIDHLCSMTDPAREAADCGAKVIYYENQPPAIDESEALLADKSKLLGLKMPDPLGGGRMHDRVQGVALCKELAGESRMIEGWVEGPCAEGADLRGINHLMMDFLDDPGFVHDLFAFNVEMAIAFARVQVDAGADYIGVGDAAASLIGPRIYEEFVFPHQKRLVDAIHRMGLPVRLHICGNTEKILPGIARLGVEIFDLDFCVPMARARELMGPDQVIFGNIDPVRQLLHSSPEQVYRDIARCHQEAGDNYVIGAGCEVPRGTPEACLMALADYARDTAR